MVENAHFLAFAAEAREDGEKREEHAQEGQDAKVLGRMAIVACLECVMNTHMLEVESNSLFSCLSS